MPGYTLPDGVTLKNLLDATSHAELESLSAPFVAVRIRRLELGDGPKGNFDGDHLRAIHQHVFQDVFEWAGQTRGEAITLSDGTIATERRLLKKGGLPFLDGFEIAEALDAVGAELQAANHLRGLARKDFAERAADVMTRLNGIHPFREGNGRTQRCFLRELAKEAGHSLDFSVVSSERMIQASILANEQDDGSMMRRMFDEISDPDRVANLRRGIAALEKADFDWNGHYVATVEPGHTVELVLAGISGEQFMARTRSEILFGDVRHLPAPTPERGQSFVITVPAATRENPRIDSERGRWESLPLEELRAEVLQLRPDVAGVLSARPKIQAAREAREAAAERLSIAEAEERVAGKKAAELRERITEMRDSAPWRTFLHDRDLVIWTGLREQEVVELAARSEWTETLLRAEEDRTDLAIAAEREEVAIAVVSDEIEKALAPQMLRYELATEILTEREGLNQGLEEEIDGDLSLGL